MEVVTHKFMLGNAGGDEWVATIWFVCPGCGKHNRVGFVTIISSVEPQAVKMVCKKCKKGHDVVSWRKRSW